MDQSVSSERSSKEALAEVNAQAFTLDAMLTAMTDAVLIADAHGQITQAHIPHPHSAEWRNNDLAPRG
jgi:hypothetical protein